MSLDNQIYQNYIAYHFGKNKVSTTKDYLRHATYFRANYLPHLPADKNSKVVDLACGMGHFVYFLQKQGYTNALGVDFSPQCVQHCQKMGLAVIESNLFDWLRANKADVLIANDVLEHLNPSEFEEFLSLANKALNPGGTLIIKVPNAANPITGAALRYIDYTHKISFTELSLDAALRCFFSQVSIKGQNLFVYYLNPLNYVGLIGQWVFDKLFYLLACLYGQSELKIFKKSIIAVCLKNSS